MNQAWTWGLLCGSGSGSDSGSGSGAGSGCGSGLGNWRLKGFLFVLSLVCGLLVLYYCLVSSYLVLYGADRVRVSSCSTVSGSALQRFEEGGKGDSSRNAALWGGFFWLPAGASTDRSSSRGGRGRMVCCRTACGEELKSGFGVGGRTGMDVGGAGLPYCCPGRGDRSTS